jgi:nucleotide-binding universal stress UspA family protein
MEEVVLVGVDRSAASRRAGEFVTALASASQMQVVVAHIVPWSPYAGTTIEENERRHPRREAELDHARREIAEPVAEALRAAGVQVDVVVRHGQPAQTLSQLAEQRRAAQIVVGRTGETGLRALLFGGVASSIVQLSPVPVTVVP